jgi:hypothetical protein
MMPALEQHFPDQPQTQWEPEIKPHGLGNDLRWKTVLLVADGRRLHGVALAINH